MRLRKSLVAAAALAAATTGCGGPASGTVERKDYVEPNNWTYMQPVYVTTCSGNPLVCTQTLTGYIPIEMHSPECWRLHLREDDEQEDICVSRQTYDGTAVGDYFREPA